MRAALLLAVSLIPCAGASPDGDIVELSIDHVRDIKGDGPDKRGNTADDTWQFWFELVRPKDKFLHLDIATKKMSETQRRNGIPGKVTGPIGLSSTT